MKFSLPGNKSELQSVWGGEDPDSMEASDRGSGSRGCSESDGVFACPAGLCSLATVCCYLAGMDLLHRVSMLPDRVDGSLGWSLYLALISSPLHMMAAALLLWAARSHSRSYYRMSAYRVA